MNMAENTVLEDIETDEVESRLDFKAKVLTDHKVDGIDETFQRAIKNDCSIVFTNKSTPHANIADYVDVHTMKIK